MGRRSNRKQNRGSRKNQNSSIEEIFLTDNCHETTSQSRYSPELLESLRKELKEAIAKIYLRFFSQFQSRKVSRVLSQDPTLSVTESDELNIEKNYCNELTQKVKQLVHFDSLDDIYITFCQSTKDFMAQIYSELQGIRNSDPCLQLACLGEAYFVVRNSWNELGKVTQGIFEKKYQHLTCENVTKLAFLDEVVKHYSGMIKTCSSQDVCQTVKNVITMEKELWEFGGALHTLDKNAKSQKNTLLVPSANTNFRVDEIVNFINGDFKEIKRKANKGRRVSKASTADTSASPYHRRSREELRIALEDSNFSSTLDKEIEEFQGVLESAQPLYHKFKPSFSEEWIKKIRSLLHNKLSD